MTTECRTLTAGAEPLDLLEPDWQTLVRSRARPLPFDAPAWHRAWWAHFGAGRSPIFLAAREDGALRGVLPLMTDGETLAVAGDPEICDYTAFPIAASSPDAILPPMLQAVDVLPWRMLHLWGLPEEATALAETQKWALQRGYDVEVDFEAVCPRVPLAPDWDTYLAGLTKKDRHELKRKMRRFAESGADVCLRVLQDPIEVAGALDTFFNLHRISRHDKAQFMTAPMEAFFRDMSVALAGLGWIRLFMVDVDGVAAAALLGFRSGDELLLYNSGYDPAYAHVSVGVVSKALALQCAIDDHMQTFDFLRGAEPYKYDLGGQDRIVRQLWVRRRGRDR